MFSPKCEVKKKVHNSVKDKIRSSRGDFLLDFEVKESVNFTVVQKAGLIYALKLQREILNSQEFKYQFINLMCRQKELNGEELTMKEIYDLVLKGKSNLDSTEDHDLDYSITLYEDGSNTIGKTSMSTGKISTNKKYFDRWIKDESFHLIASHLFHEYLHSCGFMHRWDWGRKRQSMVYRAGYLVRDLVKQKMEGRSFSPISNNK